MEVIADRAYGRPPGREAPALCGAVIGPLQQGVDDLVVARLDGRGMGVDRLPPGLRDLPPELRMQRRLQGERDVQLSGDRPSGRHAADPAEVDDIAMMRLLVREGVGLGVLPPIVIQDELSQGLLAIGAALPGIVERFYAVTIARRFPNHLLQDLLLRQMP